MTPASTHADKRRFCVPGFQARPERVANPGSLCAFPGTTAGAAQATGSSLAMAHVRAVTRRHRSHPVDIPHGLTSCIPDPRTRCLVASRWGAAVAAIQQRSRRSARRYPNSTPHPPDFSFLWFGMTLVRDMANCISEAASVPLIVDDQEH